MHIFHSVTLWVLNLIQHLGYAGLFGGMMFQATGFVPLPSEVMMSFGGYLAHAGSLALWLVILAGALGDVIGAIIAYVIGYYGGRPFLLRFGRIFFVREAEIRRADRWFERFGSRAVLICKLLPGIRAIAALPAGITRMPLGIFIGYTSIGAAIWCTAFASLGYTLGQNWSLLEPFFRRFSILLLGVLVLAIGFWIWSHFRAEKQAAKA
jgi:membrane protein DedA with SNARE-associated domain